MALNPSPQRQSVITFPTPNVGDILFFETVDAERIGINIPEYGTKHPDYKKWPNHRLVHVESADDQSRYYRFYYAADQEGQDDDNWSFGQADIGNTKFDSVSRRYVIRRTEFDPQSPAMGSAMPDVPEGKFTGTYVLAERRQQPTGDKILDGLYVIEERTYVKKVTITSIDFDEFFRTSNETKQTLYYRGELIDGIAINVRASDPDDAYWGITTDGYIRSVKQISDNWWLVVEQQVVKVVTGTPATSVSFSYDTSINYSFPPVLGSVEIDEWPRRDGAVERYPRIVYSQEGYSGPCRATVTAKWQKVKHELPSISEPPLPLPIVFATPLFSLSVPATLHAQTSFVVTTGTSDPQYEYVGGNYVFPATNYTSWSAMSSGLTVSAEQKPYRGGWLLETVVVYPP